MKAGTSRGDAEIAETQVNTEFFDRIEAQLRTTAEGSPARVRRSRINLQDFQDLRECAIFETSLQPVPPASKPSLPEAAELLLAAMLGHIGEAVCGESLLNFSGLRAGVPQVSPQGGTSRLGAAALFVSMGRGAAPSGPLTSGYAIAVSRRQWRASPRGVGRRRRAVPTPEKRGTSRLNLGSAQRAAPTL